MINLFDPNEKEEIDLSSKPKKRVSRKTPKTRKVAKPTPSLDAFMGEFTFSAGSSASSPVKTRKKAEETIAARAMIREVIETLHKVLFQLGETHE